MCSRGSHALCLVKTSHTFRMNNFEKRAVRRCDKVFCHDTLPATLDRLDLWRLPPPSGFDPGKYGSPPTTVGTTHQTTSSSTIDRPQDVLDCLTETLVGMERLVGSRHPKNGCDMASGGLPAVLELAFADEATRRQKACEPRDPDFDLPHGGENPTWGAPRIHGELLKLGFVVSEPTVSRWLRKFKKTPDPDQRWLTFLRNHREAIAAMDFFTVPTLTFGVLYG